MNKLGPNLKNYITPDGLDRMRDEFKQLRSIERPKIVETVAWAASNGDRSENGDYIYGKKRLREIDRRLRYLINRIKIAEVVDNCQQKNHDLIFFGATVTYANIRNEQRTIKIVGVDEARLEKGEISWISPVARALMKASKGDIVKVVAPAGLEELEVIAIEYL
ncbi:MAG: transcription elongation factor GreB [Rhodospirillaceae bacterium TMED8]|nr:transcription elongation factor GreB [Magnetovibrio sp.]OUT49045.1 MAG: transcription elongation factor GreB [Rhodospirillaceae bacterium TMED8]|tara:strand:+ start:7744 stop:8235 length:492 start_codon:yes stop_codon:yes gene_type:complete